MKLPNETIRKTSRVSLRLPERSNTLLPGPNLVLSSSSPAKPSPPASTLDSLRTESGPRKLTDRLTGAAESTSDFNLPFRSPQCGTASTVRWDKLQIGKVPTCPHCRRMFTTRLDGHLAEVAKGNDGRWVDEEARNERRQRTRSKRRRLVVGLAASVVLVAASLWSPAILKSWSSTAEAELPIELEPRAELFAQARLNGDVRTMKRLTDPVQDRLLFLWCKKNPAPAGYNRQLIEGDVTIGVDVVSSQHPLSVLRVYFDGVALGRGGSKVQLQLTWEERGRTWHFQPVPKGA